MPITPFIKRCLALVLALCLLPSLVLGEAFQVLDLEATDAFFESSVFVGDSILRHLGNYHAGLKKKGRACWGTPVSWPPTAIPFPWAAGSSPGPTGSPSP